MKRREMKKTLTKIKTLIRFSAAMIVSESISDQTDEITVRKYSV